MATMDSVELLLNRISETLPEDRKALRRLKAQIASHSGQPLIRNDALLSRYRQDIAKGLRQPNRKIRDILTLNNIRSESGIATVTVITKPYACPGRCIYCPDEARAPKSYLPNEPAIMRALRNDYDPYRQMQSRLAALYETGHPTDKIELITKGGTWSFYPEAYQREFIQRCYEAANDYVRGGRRGARGAGNQKTTGNASTTLEKVQRANETAKHRIIGITIETRPDYVDEAEIERLRKLGVTRVELGVQCLDDEILRFVNRDHITIDIKQATKLLREAGFKIAYHIMPNLPGMSLSTDLDTMRELFDNPAYRPDAIKLYPCVVMEAAELFRWWKDGRYHPYEDNALIELLIQMKLLVPTYVRIERVIRDIPSASIQAGSRNTNLRQVVHRRMKAQALKCRCIRCRQVREVPPERLELKEYRYEAAGGTEIFLSLEDSANDRLASLLRLRIPAHSSHKFHELNGAALIRELHTYGKHVPLSCHDTEAAQHHGYGMQLLKESERIVRDQAGLRRIAVIAGTGAREYYRRLGYELEGTYMVKTLTAET